MHHTTNQAPVGNMYKVDLTQSTQVPASHNTQFLEGCFEELADKQNYLDQNHPCSRYVHFVLCKSLRITWKTRSSQKVKTRGFEDGCCVEIMETNLFSDKIGVALL